MKHKIILQNFRKFLDKNGDTAFKKLSDFFAIQKQEFYELKIDELQKMGISKDEAVIKARQGWVSVIGRALEDVIEILISNFCQKHNLKITNDRALKGSKLNVEQDAIKRALMVHFGSYSVLPDADLIIYKLDSEIPKVLAILSVKNSFRERYTETPYWKLKLMQSTITNHIKVFMITPDPDDEISSGDNPRKSRIVMEYELDGIYLAKDKFDATNKIKGIENLISDLEKIL